MITAAAYKGGIEERDFWGVRSKPGASFNFGKYMPRDRYFEFKKCWHTGNNKSNSYPGGPLYKLRWLIDTLHASFEAAMEPGLYLVEDESIIPWDGRGMPYRKSIDRKPHDGWFLWDVAGSSKIIWLDTA
jgi:hypothetical protein